MAKDLISDGLAVGYFYNFVKRMFDNIGPDSLVRSDGKAFDFPYAKANLEVVVPRMLNEAEIEKCKDFVFKNREVRLSIERGRDMSFFVENPKGDSKKALDFPTTIGSIIDFLKIDIDNLSGFIETDVQSEEWKERARLEVEKFKSVLEFLIESYTITRGKVKVVFLDEN